MSLLTVNGKVKQFTKTSKKLTISQLKPGELFRFKSGRRELQYMMLGDGTMDRESSMDYCYEPLNGALDWEADFHFVNLEDGLAYAQDTNSEVVRLKGTATISEEK